MQEVSKHLPHLSHPQASVLALYSFATVMVQSCDQSRVAAFLALVLEKKENTVRQQLREFCYEVQHAGGALCRAVPECGLSRLRLAGGLDRLGGEHAWRLASRLGSFAAAGGICRPPRLAGDPLG